MKKKTVKAMLGLAVVSILGMTAPAVSAAETETETVSTELESESETETETETEAAPDVEVKQDGKTIVTLKNESGYVVKEALAGTTETAEEETETETAAEKEENVAGITLTGEDGEVHVFPDADVTTMTEPVLVKDHGFLYIQYKNAEGKEKEAAETAEEVEFDQPETMYVVNDVYIRAEANGDSEALASLGQEIRVIGAAPKWYKVEQGEVTGYIARSFLSKDKESADAAVKAEEAAQAQAAAAAAAQQAAAQASAGQSSAAPQGKYEVSRQAYDDCDGSGHGYYEITYSDGSTAREEY